MSGIAEIAGSNLSPERFRRDIVEDCQPVVLRGLVLGWPAVAQKTPAAMRAYLGRYDAGGTMEAFFGTPGIAGHYYYDGDLTGFNFRRRQMPLAAALDAMLDNLERQGAETIYAGSLPVVDYLPGFADSNPMPLLAGIDSRIWIGQAADISAHYDTADNLACVVAGRRRFTLYSPDLIASLYPGPIDNTLSGQPVSLAASQPPDAARFPRFFAAQAKALTAELEPGDALYLPKLWWHRVQSTAPFNIMVNYWWDAFLCGPDAPYTAMLLAMITLAERPPQERRAWKSLFDHYVFREDGHPLAHLDAARHGVLGPLKDNYGRIRARVMQLLHGT